MYFATVDEHIIANSLRIEKPAHSLCSNSVLNPRLPNGFLISGFLGAGRRGLVVENSTRKDVSQALRDLKSAMAKWSSLTDGHILVIASCHRNGR